MTSSMRHVARARLTRGSGECSLRFSHLRARENLGVQGSQTHGSRRVFHFTAHQIRPREARERTFAHVQFAQACSPLIWGRVAILRLVFHFRWCFILTVTAGTSVVAFCRIPWDFMTSNRHHRKIWQISRGRRPILRGRAAPARARLVVDEGR